MISEYIQHNLIRIVIEKLGPDQSCLQRYYSLNVS